MNQPESQPAYLEHISPVGKRIYQLIKQNHMTKADIRNRTSLPTKQIDDQLKRLAQYNIIKSKKVSQKKNAKTWMLFTQKQQQQQEQIKAQNEDLIALILKKQSTTLAQLKKQAIKSAYNLEKFQQLIQMLRMKGEIYVIGDQVKRRKMKRLCVPCVGCELKRLCGFGNVISPDNCPYLQNW